MALSTFAYNILTCWLPALTCVATVSLLRRRLAHKLRWKSMLLRVTAAHVSDDGSVDDSKLIVTDKERRVLTTLLQNITLLSALGATLAVSLLIAPTEIIYDAGDWSSTSSQYFIFLTFVSTGSYMVVVIESALTLLYLEQYTDAQLHALLCERAAELFVEPLLAFITSTIYLLAAGVVFCGYLYGGGAVVGLSLIVVIPVIRIARSWSYLENFDSRSFALARRLQRGSSLKDLEDDGSGAAGGNGGSGGSLSRQMTVVGQSKLLDAMREAKRIKANAKSPAYKRVRSLARNGMTSAAEKRVVAAPCKVAPNNSSITSTSSSGGGGDGGAPVTPRAHEPASPAADESRPSPKEMSP